MSQRSSLIARANHLHISRHPTRQGALRTSRNARRDAVDVEFAKDDRKRSRTAKSCGPYVQRFFALGENSRNPCELRVSMNWRPAPRCSRNRVGPYQALLSHPALCARAGAARQGLIWSGCAPVARGRLCAGRIGDGLKPLYGRLMALAMWPG